MLNALRPRPLPIYAGWWVISAPFLAAMLTVGSGQYAFGLLIEPLEQEFGWTRTQINLSLSFTAVGSFVAPYLGYIMDRHGAKNILVVSMALIVVSYLLRPFMTELWHWYALSFIQYLGFSGASILPAGRLVGIWFQRSRGRVMGITLMGNNFGGITFPQLTTLALGMSWHWAFISLSPWQGTYLLFGVIGILMTVYALIVVREFPTRAQMRRRDNEEDAPSDDAPVVLTGWTLKESLRTKAFYAITVAMMLGSLTYTGVLTQVAAHLTDEGVSSGAAAIALSLLAGCGMTGKLVMGLLADWITATVCPDDRPPRSIGLPRPTHLLRGTVYLVAHVRSRRGASARVGIRGLLRLFPGRIRRAHAAHRAGRIRHQVLRQHHGRDEHHDGGVLCRGTSPRGLVVRRYGKLPRCLSADCCALLQRRDVAIPGEQSHAEGRVKRGLTSMSRACPERSRRDGQDRGEGSYNGRGVIAHQKFLRHIPRRTQMQVVRKGQNDPEDRTDAPIFYGGKVEGEAIVGGGMSGDFNFNKVSFFNGAKNHFHTHTSDQILFVLSGKGYVTTDAEQIEVGEGDTALIPAGERHWHGAVDGEDFSHISLTHPTSETTVYDD